MEAGENGTAGLSVQSPVVMAAELEPGGVTIRNQREVVPIVKETTLNPSCATKQSVQVNKLN